MVSTQDIKLALDDGQPQPRLYDLNENRQDPLSNTQYAFAWTLCVLRISHC